MQIRLLTDETLSSGLVRANVPITITGANADECFALVQMHRAFLQNEDAVAAASGDIGPAYASFVARQPVGGLSLSSAAPVSGNLGAGVLLARVAAPQGGTIALVDNGGGRVSLTGRSLLSTSTSFVAGVPVNIILSLDGIPRTITLYPAGRSGVAAGPTFGALSLAAPVVAENTAQGTTISGFVGQTSGSAISLTNTAGGRFALSAGVLVAGATNIDYDAATGGATSYQITARETKVGYTDRDTVLTVNVSNVLEGATLNALSLSSLAFTVGTAANGAITGATVGEAITAASLPTGLTINGPARTWAYDGTGSAGTSTPSLTGSLADSPNSPRVSNLSVTIAAAGVPSIAFASSSASIAEGNSGTQTVANTINVTRNGVTGDLVVNLTYSGTADGTDYSGPSSVTILAANSSVSFNTTINGDTTVEADETIIIAAALAAYPASTASKTITVTNDDATALTLAQKGNPSLFYNGSLPVNLVEATPGVFSSNYSDATFAGSGTTYYVLPTGSDANDGLSSGTAWRTLQKYLTDAPSGSQCITTLAGRYGALSVPAGKSMTIIGPSNQLGIIGDVIGESDISAWGTYASGRQSVTLTTGAVSFFVDLTQFRGLDEQGRPVPQVSCVATTAAGIATWQANKDFDAAGAATTDDPVAGVFRSTPSQIGAAVPRDLTGKADTEIVMCRRTAAPAITLTATSQLFLKNFTVIGGATEAVVPVGGRLVATNCRFLGAEAQNLGLNGTSVLHQCVVAGCSNPGQDLVDYSSTGGTATMVEIDCLFHQCSPSGADDCSTLHGGRGMRINGRYLHASHPIDDANAPIIVGVFGSKLRAANVSTTFAIGLESQGELHIAGVTFLPGPFKAFNFTKSASILTMMKVFDYDGCLTGKTAAATSNLTPTLRTTAKPTADTIFVDIDLSIANLKQDTAGTTAVTTVGDPVTRINLASGEFITVVGGTYTYQLDGTKPVLRGGTANAQAFAFNLTDTVMDENTNFILGVKSADTGGILVQLTLTSTAGDYRSSGNLTGAVGTGAAAAGFHPGAPTYTVDGSATTLTTATQLKTAAMNNAPRVISVLGANTSYVGWMRMQSFMVQFDGDFYGGRVVRATDSTNLRAHQTVVANRTGATLV